MTTTETTVAANGASAPGAASPGSDLNALLEQFKAGTKANDNVSVVKLLEGIKPVVDHVIEEKQTKDFEREKSDVKSAVDSFRKEAEIPADVPDRIVRGFLRDVATERPEFSEAWAKRYENPQAWQTQLMAAKPEWEEEFKKLPNNKERSDVERAVASVRNVSTSPAAAVKHDPVALVNMSDRDYEQYKQKHGL